MAKGKRKSIPKDIQTAVLTDSRRRCAACFGLNRDTAIKQGQIAHLDEDPTNADRDNLVFLCLDHHDEFDGRRGLSKGLTVGEMRRFRDELYASTTVAWRQAVNFGAVSVKPPDEFSGLWVRIGDDDDDSAELEIELIAPQKVRVRGYGLHGRTRDLGPNIGQVDFEADLTKGTATFTRDVYAGRRYTLGLKFGSDNVLVASEEGWGGFGLGVHFAGQYARTK